MAEFKIRASEIFFKSFDEFFLKLYQIISIKKRVKLIVQKIHM